jgi:hypothetical protein
MKKAVLILMVAGLLGFVGIGTAIATTANLYFKGPDSTDATYSIPGDGTAYAGPYDFTINSQSPEVRMYCDDATDNIYDDESWTANVYSGSSLSNALWYNTKVSVTEGLTTVSATGLTLYEAMFYLTSEEMKSAANSSTGANSMAEYQAAIWAVGDPSILSSDQYAKEDLYAAIAAVTNNSALDSSLLSEFEVYSYAGGGVIPPTDGAPPQEFIRYVPEPNSLIFLGFSLLMVAGAVTLKVRKAHA